MKEVNIEVEGVQQEEKKDVTEKKGIVETLKEVPKKTKKIVGIVVTGITTLVAAYFVVKARKQTKDSAPVEESPVVNEEITEVETEEE